ncbi:MAG TPA: ABC transporter substrate-binding protein [Acidimicrobiales bacterium]|nr:ABC transporter substrate-binding protein [Acidimicrobiales bacterium]
MATRRGTLAAWAALALLLPGCGLVGDDDEAAPAQPTLPAATALLRVATFDWPTCLNPLTCADPAARWLVWEHVLPKLVEVDVDGAYVASPVLAGMPEVRVDDATGQQTITYVLDPDARWHDGRPITSSDVTGTWMARQATPGALTGGYELITAVDDRDPLVARVTLSQAFADWPELFGGHDGYLLEADALGGELDLTGRFEDELDFGAGPFAVGSVEDRAIVLEARQEHWAAGRQAAVDQVRLEQLPLEAADDLDAGVPGGVDLVVPPGGEPVESDRFGVVERRTTDVVGLFLDRRSPPLGSLAVRRAVEEAVDRRPLVELLGAGDEADLLTCPGLLHGERPCGDRAEEEVASAADAAALLEADGWIRDPGGGRGRPGLPLLVPVSYDPMLDGAEAVAEAVRDALEPAGFGVVLQPTDAFTWWQGDRTGSTGIGVFAAPMGTAGRLAALHRCDLGGLGPLGWCEPATQDLVGALMATPRLEERRTIAQQLSQLVTTTASWLPVAQRTVALMVDPERAEVPDVARLGSGPLGGLHRMARIEG